MNLQASRIVFKIVLIVSVFVNFVYSLDVPSNYIVYAIDLVKIGDRAGTNGNGLIGSADKVVVGSDANVQGTILAKGDVKLFDRCIVYGDVISLSNVYTYNGASVSGTIKQDAEVPVYSIPTKSFQSGSQDINLLNDQSVTINAGSYDTIRVLDRGTLTINGGIYNVRAFILGNDVKLILNFSAGSGIEINSLEKIVFGDRLKMSFSDENNPTTVSFYSHGTDDMVVGYESTVYGKFTAPNAKVLIHDRTSFNGCVFGKSIELQPTIFFVSDTTFPQLILNQPVAGTTINTDTPEIKFFYSDAHSGINPYSFSVSINGIDRTSNFSVNTNTASWQVNENMAFSDGIINTEASIADRAGNTVTNSASFIIDATKPTISIMSPENGVNINTTTPHFKVELTDNLSNIDIESFKFYLNEIEISSHFNVTETGAEYQVTEENALQESEYSVLCKISDNAGNLNQISSSFVVDITPPGVTIDSPTAGYITNQSTVILNWSVDGVVQPEETVELITEGSNTISRSATDKAGNTGSTSITVTLDTQAPVVTISSPEDNFITNQQAVSVVWSIDGLLQTDEVSESLVEGQNAIVRSATDAAGNIGTASISGKLDTEPPSVSITSPLDNSITNQSAITLNWSIDGVAQPEETIELINEGINTITRSATDEAGNTGTASITVTKDTEAPVVVITSPEDGFLTNQSTITLNWSIDGVAQLEEVVELNNEGTNTISRSATDEAGNTSTASIIVTKDTKAPVVVITSPDDGFITYNNEINIAWSVDGVEQTEQMAESLVEGLNTITRTFTDAAGNIGFGEITVTCIKSGKIYTTKNDFDEGKYINITPDVPGEISIAGEAHPFNTVWVQSLNGDVYKIDAITGKVTGKFKSSPSGSNSSISVCAVDIDGNLWVADGVSEYITKIGNIDNNQCIDRNGDGIITTSLNGNEMLPWISGDSAEGVSTADDECILCYLKTHGFPVRQLSIVNGRDVWVSGEDLRMFDLVDGKTGKIKRVERSVGYGGYGGVVSRDGIMWSIGISDLLRWDTDKQLVGSEEPNWNIYKNGYPKSYAIDSAGNFYTIDSYRVIKYSPDGNIIGTYNHGLDYGNNLVIDESGDLWVSSMSSANVGHVKNDGTFLGTINVGSVSSGIGVDGNGKIWVIHYGNNLTRINPSIGDIGLDGVTPIGEIDFTTPQLYGYAKNGGDFTGRYASGTPEYGTWTVIYDSKDTSTEWSNLLWNAQICNDASIIVKISVSNDTFDFGTSVAVNNGEILNEIKGRFIKVSVHFKRSEEGDSPVLYDLSIYTNKINMQTVENVKPVVTISEDSMVCYVGRAELAATVCDDGIRSEEEMSILWQQIDGPVEIEFDSQQKYKIKPFFSVKGVYKIKCVVSDGEFEDTDTVTVTVKNNNIPVISSKPDTAVSEGELYIYDIKAFDPDGDPISYEVASGPDGMYYNENDNAIIWQTDSTAVSEYSVMVIVRDNRGGEALQTFVLKINPYEYSDLKTIVIDKSNLKYDSITMEVNGTVTIRSANMGTKTIKDPFTCILFEDINNDQHFDQHGDHYLGSKYIEMQIDSKTEFDFTISLNTVLTFIDYPISVFLDSDNDIAESNEGNNVLTSNVGCTSQPPKREFKPVLEWKWDSSNSDSLKINPYAIPVIAQISDDNNDGKIDENDFPDIIFVAASTDSPENRWQNGVLRAIQGDGSKEIFCISKVNLNAQCSPAVGDIDNDGYVEILATEGFTGDLNIQPRIYAFEHTGEIKWISNGIANITAPPEWDISLANINNDGLAEVIIGNVVLNSQGELISKYQPNDWSSYNSLSSAVVDLDDNDSMEVIFHRNVAKADGTVFWSNKNLPSGYSAIGNFDDDNLPEIVYVGIGSFANTSVRLIENDGIVKWGPVYLNGKSGGHPVVGDFDGDGEPEIGVSTNQSFNVLEHDGTIKWSSPICDTSSGSTGATAFDFDADEIDELIFADEQFLRIYDGITGSVLFEDSLGSGTLHEYPLVADVDNDGNAEIITIANRFLNSNAKAGIHVYGDANDTWVDARSIWNQHAYHITNINNDGTIPKYEDKIWLSNNSYRQNVSVNPYACDDLTASYLRIDGNLCIDSAFVVVRIGNAGGHELGAGIPVTFYEGVPADGGLLLGTIKTDQCIKQGQYIDVKYSVAELEQGIHTLSAVVNRDEAGQNYVREVNETNNVITGKFNLCNIKPVFISEPVSVASEGELYEYQAIATDEDNDTLTYSLISYPLGMSINVNTGKLSWIPSNMQSGTWNIILKVSDGHGAIATQDYSITVNNTLNDPPVFISEPVLNASEGEQYIYQVNSSDENNDPVKYFLISSPEGMVIDSATGLIIWTPDGMQSGEHKVVVAISDNVSPDVEQEYIVTVRELINTPPQILTEVLPFAKTDVAFQYTIEAIDDDNDPIGYYLLSCPVGMSIDNETGLIQWLPEKGTESINVTVAVWDNHYGNMSKDYVLTVERGENSAPYFISTPVTNATVGEQYSYAMEFSDADYDTITVSLTQNPLGMSINSDNIITWVPTRESEGLIPVTISLNDGRGGIVKQNYTITVVAGENHPPEFTSVPVIQVLEDQTYSYNVTFNDMDNDTVFYMLVKQPNGMIINESGAVIFTTSQKDVGVHDVSLLATDRIDTVYQNFTLEVVNVNDNPVIKSTPVLKITTGLDYNYTIDAIDPDGDSISYELIQAPSGMTVSSAGIVSWPNGTRPDQAQVSLKVSDGNGGVSLQSWTIDVETDLQAPIVQIDFSANPVAPGTSVTISVVATDNVAVSNIELMADSVAVQLDNNLSYIFTGGVEDTVEFHATAEDAEGNVGSVCRKLYVNTTADNTPPTVSVEFTPANPIVGDQVYFTVTASDDRGLDNEQVLLNVDGIYQSLDSQYHATWPALRAGSFPVIATVQDVSGNFAKATATVPVVISGTDIVSPVVSITAPAEDTTILGAVNIMGTVTDENFAYYTLSYKAIGTDNFVEFYRQTTSVTNGMLGSFDGTTLENGVYLMRLTGWDQYGNSASAEQTVRAEGQAKPGVFTLTFSDLTTVANGINLEVTRTYDSRNKSKGDFGIGWRVGINSIKLNELHPAGEGWNVYDAGGTQYCANYMCVSVPDYQSDELKRHTVSISLPGARPQEFDVKLSFPNTFDDYYGVASLEPKPGTYSKLEILGDPTFFKVGEDLYSFDMDGYFDPDRYKLTLLDGSYYIFDQNEGGIVEMGDPNGNTIYITNNGITHSDGDSITFIRDSEKRITSIWSSDGRTLSYEYDGLGNLSKVTDPNGNMTRFKYAANSYLKEIIDPRGIRISRTEFDEDGRMVRQINANGDTLDYYHDIYGRSETVTDFNGNETHFTYDERGNVLTKTDSKNNTWAYTYDSLGNQLSETVPGGASTSATYDSAGNKLSETDELNRSTYFAYGSNGKITSTIDALSRKTEYEYDSLGNLLQEIGPDNEVRYTREYASNGSLLSETDALGNVTKYTTYRGLVSSQTDPRGNTRTYTYNSSGNMLSETDPNGNVTYFRYDTNGNKTMEINSLGDTVLTTYSSFNKALTNTDALGNTTSYEYDNFGQLTKTVAPDSSITQRTYDALGDVKTITDEADRTTTFEYDHENRLTKTTFTDGSYTNVEYDALGRKTASVDRNGNRTEYAYDAVGNNTIVRDALGQETQYEYDEVNRKTAMVDALNQRTEYTYDDYDRLVRTDYADGTYTTIEYDLAGRKVAEVDQELKRTSFTYDSTGNLKTVTDAMNHVTEYTYDKNNNRITQTDANNHTTTMEYDALNRLTEREYPNGDRETFQYNANGNMLSKVDGEGDSTVYTYDSRNREELRRYTNSGHTVQTVYTVDGKRDSVIDHRGVTTYEWDDNSGDLVRVNNPDGTYLQYEYDDNKNKTAMITPWRRTEYRYDLLNRMDSVIADNGDVTIYFYNEVGNRDSIAHANGTGVKYTYDNLNRLTDVYNYGSDGSTISSYTYELNSAGIRTAVSEADGSRVDYGYDDCYKLTSEVRTGGSTGSPTGYSISYTYDYVGNRITKDHDGVLTTYNYNNRDQLESESNVNGDITYTYDHDGRMVTKTDGTGTTTYLWQDEDRMVGVTSAAGTISYTYDANNARVAVDDGTVTKNYLIDIQQQFAQVVAEYADTTSPTAEYVFGLERITQDRSGSISTYIADGQGSIRQLTNTSGSITDNYDYFAFGEEMSSSGSTSNEFKYVGEQFDPNAGLYYNRARWMEPENGRFVSVDPFGGMEFSPNTLHRYLYSDDNPVNYVDHSGEFTLVNSYATSTINTILASKATIIYHGIASAALSGGLNYAKNRSLKEALVAGTKGFAVGVLTGGVFVTARVFIVTRGIPGVIHAGKLTYLTKLDVGKAKGFAMLGYTAKNQSSLRTMLMGTLQLTRSPQAVKDVTVWGTKKTVEAAIVGKNGVPGLIQVTWQLDKGKGAWRLITAIAKPLKAIN